MGIWGSYYDIPKATFYLLKGDCNLKSIHARISNLNPASNGRAQLFVWDSGFQG